MQWLSKISVRRPVLATVLMLTIVVVGLVSYRGLGVDKFPKVEFPMIAITAVYPGASPASVETDVAKPLEEAVNTVSGVETLSSISSEGAALIFVQFVLEKDPEVAAQEIRDRIGALRDLPKNLRPPLIQKVDPDAAPVLMLSVKGDMPVAQLTQLAEDKIKARVETVPGVGQVRVIGGQKRQIEIQIDPIRLRAAGVSALEVQRAVMVGNISVPGGRLERGPDNATMRVDARATAPEHIADLVVRQLGDHPVRIGDVATVLDTVADADSTALRDGKTAIVLAVRKQSGSNTVAVVDQAKAAVAEIAKGLPAGVTLEVVRDNSEVIRTAVDQVTEHLILGAILAAVVVLIFLGSVRSTLIAALSIPVSIIGTFALMKVAGFTINNMTLLALALAVGIVIDDSIVVLENIYRHVEEHGEKPFPAAVKATKEIGMAVLSTTLSLMAVFLPVSFMGGIVGRFLASFGLTMAFAIALSLLVSFTLTPMLAARILPVPLVEGQAPKHSVLERLVAWGYHPIELFYRRVLGFALRHRWIVVVACVGALAAVVPLGKRAGFGFLPESDEAHFEIFLRTKEGASLDATTVLAERLARNTRKIPEVTHTLVTIADNDQKLANVASVYVRLTDPVARRRTQNQIMDAVRKTVLVDLPPGTRAAAQLVADFGAAGGQQNATIQYLLTGPDLDRLALYGQRVVEAMRKVPGVVDLDTSIPQPLPESTVRPDLDRAAALGVDPANVTSTLGLLMGGAEATSYEERGEQYAIFLRANPRFRDDPSLLGLITVPSSVLGQVPLTDLVRSEDGAGPSQISRTARARSITITCNVAPGHAEGDISAALEQALADQHLPPGYTYGPFGRSKEMGRTKSAFGFAFLMSFIFMYLVLAAQFESWLHPFTIMLALPLTLPFALLSLVLFGHQLTIFSMLGLLVLFGVVKKNAILQIDHANQLRAKGMPRDQAILDASRDRLRPILMTTFAFVAGMIPLVVSNGIGAGFSKAIAGVVVGGQTLSLVLTLIAIPVFYSLFDSLSVRARRLATWALRLQKTDRGQHELVDGEQVGAPVVDQVPDEDVASPALAAT